MLFFRIFIPVWRFFDVPEDEVILEVREVNRDPENKEGALGFNRIHYPEKIWISGWSALPPVSFSFRSFFINPFGLLRLMLWNLLDRALLEYSLSASLEEYSNSTQYKLLKNWAAYTLSTQKSDQRRSAETEFQFRLCSREIGQTGFQERMTSLVHRLE